MEIENINILKGKITTILDRNLINDFKKINTSCMPKKLFNIRVKDDIKYNGSYNKDHLDELLAQFDLNEDILSKKYSNISKSEYQKISIIIAILNNNPIFLLEDPTIGLDVKSKKALIRILKKEKRKNRIIIVVSKDSEFLFQLVNYIIYKDKNNYVICNNKYIFFSNKRLLKQFDLAEPQIINFYSEVKKNTKIRLLNRDNINDLIKEIYRHAQ